MSSKRVVKLFKGTRFETARPFYRDEYRSTYAMATSDSSFQYFQERESDTNLYRDYSKTNGNPLKTGQGRLLYVRFRIDAAAFASMDFTPTFASPTLSYTLANAYQKMRALARIEIKLGTDTIHRDALENFLPPMPWIVGPFKQGTPADAGNLFNNVQTASAEDGASHFEYGPYRKQGYYFKPAPMIYVGNALEVNLSFLPTYTIPSTLNGYLLTARLGADVIEGETVQPVKEIAA